jgi:carboxylesterase type B
MWMPVIDGDLVRNSLWDSFSKGNFVKVPTVIGATTNEGIGFSPTTSSQAQSDSFWQAEYPMMNSSHTANISALYSSETTKCSTPTCFSQQLRDSYGDMRFMCSGVSFTSAMSYWMPNKTWNYWYNVQNSPGGGVTHGIQGSAIWGSGRGSLPNSYLAGGVNANITTVMQGYWASFIRSYDPNKYRYANTSVWQAYSKTQRQRLVVDTGARTSLQNKTQLCRIDVITLIQLQV